MLNHNIEIKDKHTIEESFQNVGTNTGNLMFYNTVLTFVSQDSQIEMVKNQAEDYFDLIIMPFANIIGYHSLYTPEQEISFKRDILDVLKKYNCKFMAFGLGSQESYETCFEDPYRSLSPTLIEMLTTLSQKCHHIFVRDDNTKRILEHLDIHNAIVAGCPSILLNSNHQLGDVIDSKWRHLLDHPSEIKANLSFQFLNKPNFVEDLIRLSKKENAPFILQDEKALVLKTILCQDIPLSIDPYFTHDELRDTFRIFFKLQDWLAYIDDFNLGIGPRIHGCLVNIINENVCVNICHDSRTRGLCKTLRIPFIDVEDFMSIEDKSAASLLSRISFDKDAFNAHRTKVAKLYANEFALNGIPSSEHLENIVHNRVSTKTIPLRIIDLGNRPLPDDFDATLYKAINYWDLAHVTDDEAKQHYENYGWKEGRQYKV